MSLSSRCIIYHDNAWIYWNNLSISELPGLRNRSKRRYRSLGSARRHNYLNNHLLHFNQFQFTGRDKNIRRGLRTRLGYPQAVFTLTLGTFVGYNWSSWFRHQTTTQARSQDISHGAVVSPSPPNWRPELCVRTGLRSRRVCGRLYGRVGGWGVGWLPFLQKPGVAHRGSTSSQEFLSENVLNSWEEHAQSPLCTLWTCITEYCSHIYRKPQ